MQQNFEEILGEVSGKYVTLKPFIISGHYWDDDAIYSYHDSELWKKLTGISRHAMNRDDFGHLCKSLLRHYEMIFVEFNCEKNQTLNDFIDNNYTQISEFCLENTYQNFSSINSVLSRINSECIKYFRPYPLDSIAPLVACEMTVKMEVHWYDPIRKCLKLTDEPIRGFLTFVDDYLLYYPLEGDSAQEMIYNFVRTLFLALPKSPPSFHCVIDNGGFVGSEYEIADARCQREFSELLDEVQQKIICMEGLGVDRDIILALLDCPRLSHMVITSDFRIYLPDFNNVEICMPPLAKALYIFYLKHPEGILFRDLKFYREELLKIYMAVSNRENYDDMVTSIDLLVDSRHNCVNENRSRIRSAFLKEFCDSIASQYYITGYGRDAKKYIEIDRDRVIFQCEI